MNSRRMVTVRVRETDLRTAIEACDEWHLTLREAARGDGYFKPDPSTMRSANDGLAAVARLRAALKAAS